MVPVTPQVTFITDHRSALLEHPEVAGAAKDRCPELGDLGQYDGCRRATSKILDEIFSLLELTVAIVSLMHVYVCPLVVISKARYTCLSNQVPKEFSSPPVLASPFAKVTIADTNDEWGGKEDLAIIKRHVF